MALKKLRRRVGVDWSEPSTWAGAVWIALGTLTQIGIQADPEAWAGILDALLDPEATLTGPQIVRLWSVGFQVVGALRLFVRDGVPPDDAESAKPPEA